MGECDTVAGTAPGESEILDSLREGIAVLDRTGLIVAVNDPWRRFAESNGGATNRVGIGSNYIDVCRDADEIPLPGVEEVVLQLQAVLDGSLASFSCEYSCRGAETERWFHMEAVPLPSGGAVVCHRDITEIRSSERKIVDTSDHERQHLGALLHEGPCQTLSGIWLHANALCDDLTRLGAPQAKDASQIALLAKEAGVEIKRLLKDFLMIPIPLDDGEGLLIALEYLAEQVNVSETARCSLSLPKSIRLEDPAVARHLYRIAQEAVRNATKHASAKRLRIKLASNRKAIVLTVEDNGIGFTPKPQTSSGIGLQVMQYRARVIGATLEIRKLPVRGVAVVCIVPR